ncbi:MAG: hydantoinase/oxoprolinase family protein [Nitrososphaerales archaeon]
MGVDTGGTFTDTVLLGSNGEMLYSKVPTTPSDLSIGILNSLNEIKESRHQSVEDILSKTVKFAHGTTATVNAMIQHRGAKVGLITTRGFKDHLLIMRGGRAVGVPQGEKLRFARVSKPSPMVPYFLTEEVTERVDYAGRVVVPLNRKEAETAVNSLLRKGVETICVSFLWSFRNPKHEQEVRKIIAKKSPNTFVTTGSELFPVIGEYERTATAAMNCYLSPTLKKYVYNLQAKLGKSGFKKQFLLMQSTGGLIPGREAPLLASSTLNSGLAAGVMASQYLGKLLGYGNIITADMGGTSFEIGIISEGTSLISRRPLSPRGEPYVSRYTLLVPSIDITAMGSGGGSIAWLDGEALRVGPISAGADPGPACYGRGGTDPAVTDADVVLGFLNPEFFLGGRMKIDPALSKKAILDKIAKPLRVDLVEAARGIYNVVNSQMADFTRKVTVERGYDPREFMLFVYGGAGPVHCGAFGIELGSMGILIPGSGFAAAHSALGAAISDLKSSSIITKQMVMPVDPEALASVFKELEDKTVAKLLKWGATKEQINLSRSIDMRYRRQVSTVNIPVSEAKAEESFVSNACHAFETKYESLYGANSKYSEAGIEMVNFIVEGFGRLWQPTLQKHQTKNADSKIAFKSSRQVFFGKSDDYQKTPVFDGSKLEAGMVIKGPAIVEFEGTTAVVQPGQSAVVDEYLNLVLKKDE